MKSYSLNLFENGSLTAFYRAQVIVKMLIDPPEGDDPWRCHEVVRVVKTVLDSVRLHNEPELPFLTVVDGKFDRVDHSWLAFRGCEGMLVILDVYAVGSLPQVQMHDAQNIAVNHRERYTPSHLPRTDIREPAIRQLIEGYREHVEAIRTLALVSGSPRTETG